MRHILHIASFCGNIGDNINHAGFYDLFANVFSGYQVDQIEMRDFYASAKNRKRFDAQFIKQINAYDLLILGGGGFFDLRWDFSATGTTIDLDSTGIDKIEIPVLVNAMGYHEYPDAQRSVLYEKFTTFIANISRKNWFVTVRNDGSYERMFSRYAGSSLSGIIKVPDNGFLYSPPKDRFVHYKKAIGLCITNDLFTEEFNGFTDPVNFNRTIAEYIDQLAAAGYQIVLFPHTPSDVSTASIVLDYVSRQTQRTAITVAPFATGGKDEVDRLAQYYMGCCCVVGMRFHSLVLALDCNIPTVALAGHQQIESLFAEVGLSKHCIRANSVLTADTLFARTVSCCSEAEHLREKYISILSDLKSNSKHYENLVEKFLTQYKWRNVK